MTGRAFIRLLQPFDPEITVYDPYLAEERAAALGVRRAASLEELMANFDMSSPIMRRRHRKRTAWWGLNSWR